MSLNKVSRDWFILFIYVNNKLEPCSDSDSEWEEVADLDAPMEEPEEVKEMSLEERRAKAKEITAFRY